MEPIRLLPFMAVMSRRRGERNANDAIEAMVWSDPSLPTSARSFLALNTIDRRQRERSGAAARDNRRGEQLLEFVDSLNVAEEDVARMREEYPELYQLYTRAVRVPGETSSGAPAAEALERFVRRLTNVLEQEVETNRQRYRFQRRATSLRAHGADIPFTILQERSAVDLVDKTDDPLLLESFLEREQSREDGPRPKVIEALAAKGIVDLDAD